MHSDNWLMIRSAVSFEIPYSWKYPFNSVTYTFYLSFDTYLNAFKNCFYRGFLHYYSITKQFMKSSLVSFYLFFSGLMIFSNNTISFSDAGIPINSNTIFRSPNKVCLGLRAIWSQSYKNSNCFVSLFSYYDICWGVFKNIILQLQRIWN